MIQVKKGEIMLEGSTPFIAIDFLIMTKAIYLTLREHRSSDEVKELLTGCFQIAFEEDDETAQKAARSVIDKFIEDNAIDMTE